MESKNLLFENEDSVTSVDISDSYRVVFDSDNCEVILTNAENVRKSGNTDRKEVKSMNQGRRTTNFNIDLLKAAFHALGQVTEHEKDAHDQTVHEINLSFSDLSYSVKHGIRRETKCILNHLNGEFRAGELTAIMGPSGAGKSSLMDVMTGFITSGIAGSIKTNGVERDLRTFARQSCYIMQDDVLCPLITVQEAMTMAAHLKLGPRVKRKTERIKKILQSLGLKKCKNVMTGKLSGGQRKRLAIAMELVSNPPVMFFDEPTSGLDSSTSKQCISLLKDLAQSGRTIVCTIHQPSASLFEIFDHIYAVQDGSCMYSGGTKGLVAFMAEQGLECPHHYNPADFMLEVASMFEYASEVPKLVKAIDNGKCTDWRKRPTTNGMKHEVVQVTENVPPSPVEENVTITVKDIPDQKHREQKSPIKSRKQEMKPSHSHQRFHTYPTSFWAQFSANLIRNFRVITRDLFFTQLQFFVHLLVGLILGILFYDIGNNAAHVSHNFSLIFFSIMFNMFTAFSAGISYYPQVLPTLVREHFNKWYSLKAHYIATTISAFPVKAAGTIAYMSLVYFMSAQPMEMDRFLKSLGMILLVDIVSYGFGLLLGAAMSVQNSSVFGPLLTAPFILFSGYFVLISDAPLSLKWLFHASYFKYALEGIMITIYGGHRAKMICSEDYCHFMVPQKFLQQIGMDQVDYWFNVGVLLVIAFLLRVIAYYTLRFRITYFKK